MGLMKALVTTEPQTVSIQEVEIPTPREGQILVKVVCVAQNPTDWKTAETASPGRILGCDFAGIVADRNATDWRDGQRVAGWTPGGLGDPTRGSFAEYLASDASLVYAVPDDVSDQQAAAVPLAFATAVQAMYQRLQLPEPARPAQSAFPFLIYGGSTSVGGYAIQLAKLSGLYVVATGSKTNHDLLLSLGADAVVDYNDADWPEQVRKMTHDELEHALDCISADGALQGIVKAMSLRKGGHVVGLKPVGKAVKPGEAENTKVRLESTIAYTVFGFSMKETPYYPAYDYCGDASPEDRAHWEKWLSLLPDLLSSGKIKPNEVRDFGGLDDIPAGFHEHKQGKVRAERLVYRIG